MNKITRKQLNQIIDKLADLQNELEELASEEQDKADNLPENLIYSQVGEKLQEQADSLQEQADSLNDVIDNLNELVEA